MSNSTSTLDTIPSNTAQPEVPANALIDAASPATVFGRRASSTTALTWGFYGATILLNGVLTQISNGTVALAASTTNYVEATRAGVVSKNTTGFTAGSIPLYQIVTGAATITSYTDYRAWVTFQQTKGLLAKVLSADANYTLTAAEARNDILQFTSSLALTAQRNIVVPGTVQQFTVFNNTTGAQNLQFIAATGTGIAVAAGKRAILYFDGTNVVRVTADT